MFSSNTSQVSNDAVFVEDVFSTYLYTGNGSTQTITNGIDLAGNGGMVWIKCRSSAENHNLFDTLRGNTKQLSSDLTNANRTETDFTSFNSNGFSFNGPGSVAGINTGTRTYVSWAFREAPKFFDVVTYTGTGANRTIAHSLGQVPGMIVVKRTDTTGDWEVYHRSLANTEYAVLNTTAAKATDATMWNSTTPTASVFSLGTNTNVNASGGTYVAYLFAHDTATDGIIQCGSFTTDASGNFTAVTLGWEPQYLLVKRTNSTGDWVTVDTMRGFDYSNGADRVLSPNTSAAEGFGGYGVPSATGFGPDSSGGSYSSSSTYIYIAIRRGPMRVPTSGASVFSPQTRTGNGTSDTKVTTTFVVDSVLFADRGSGEDKRLFSRLTGGGTGAPFLKTNNTEAEGSMWWKVDFNNGYTLGYTGTNASSRTFVDYIFRRAPGVFDAVCFTGTGTTNQRVSHNLGVVPEMLIVKSRSGSGTGWYVYTAANPSDQMQLNSTGAKATGSSSGHNIWGTAPAAFTTTDFGVDMWWLGATLTDTMVAYLFATLPGISKVFSYTGNGSSQTINCGFTGGARFVLIKRTDSTGDWYVWDSTRGIVAANDPHLSLNTTAAEVTTDDSVDTDSTGFIVNQVAATNVNVNAATYIGLAIA